MTLMLCVSGWHVWRSLQKSVAGYAAAEPPLEKNRCCKSRDDATAVRLNTPTTKCSSIHGVFNTRVAESSRAPSSSLNNGDGAQLHCLLRDAGGVASVHNLHTRGGLSALTACRCADAAVFRACLRHILVRLGRLFHHELGARNTDRDAFRLQRVEHLLRVAIVLMSGVCATAQDGANERAWYSSLCRELLRLRARPAPWQVLRATADGESELISGHAKYARKAAGCAPAKRLLHALLGTCKHVAAGSLC